MGVSILDILVGSLILRVLSTRPSVVLTLNVEMSILRFMLVTLDWSADFSMRSTLRLTAPRWVLKSSILIGMSICRFRGFSFVSPSETLLIVSVEEFMRVLKRSLELLIQ